LQVPRSSALLPRVRAARWVRVPSQASVLQWVPVRVPSPQVPVLRGVPVRVLPQASVLPQVPVRELPQASVLLRVQVSPLGRVRLLVRTLRPMLVPPRVGVLSRVEVPPQVLVLSRVEVPPQVLVLSRVWVAPQVWVPPLELALPRALRRAQQLPREQHLALAQATVQVWVQVLTPPAGESAEMSESLWVPQQYYCSSAEMSKQPQVRAPQQHYCPWIQSS
jgi:hypothetical protein